MGFLRLSGVVIRESDTGEGDKMLTILAKNNGKITGFAKGAKRNRSSLLAGTQLLAYSDFVLFKGKESYNISSCEIIEPFYDIRNDVIKLTYAAHILELVSDIIVENQPSNKTLKLLLNTLYMLSKNDRSPQLITRIFELRQMAIMGYTPSVRNCLVCGCDQMEQVYFSFKQCGFVCEGCKNKEPGIVKISLGAARAIHHIVHADLDHLFGFSLSEEVLDEVSKISKRYVKDRMERDYHKLDMLKFLS